MNPPSANEQVAGGLPRAGAAAYPGDGGPMRRTLLVIAGAAAAAIVGVGVTMALSADPAVPPSPGTVAARIAAAAQAGATTGEELAAAAGLPAEGPGSLRLAPDGTLAATVTFAAPPTGAQLEELAAIARVERVFDVAPSVAVRVEPARLGELAAVDGVVSADPDLTPAVRDPD